jgi:sterol desaturase/sphingolipid hydroxylase (fatty acid hydroxylase superfamily)
VDEKYVAIAIPFFFLLIGVEILALRARGLRGAYRFADSITNLSCGVGQQILEPFFKSAILVPYAWLYARGHAFSISPRSPLAWVVVVFAVDFVFYVFHRVSHRVGFLWAVHAVHHQSEEYNLSVALRQPWLQTLAGAAFYLPLAVLGVPPAMFLGVLTIDTLYQFWIHTRLIGRLGPIEWILNTPSHHRVHHGADPQYLDRNYAGIFIVWDRLFGTYCREDGEPVYGTVKPASSWNPLAVNTMVWRDLASASRRTRSFVDKVLVWLAPPDWRPRDLGGSNQGVAPTKRTRKPRYDVRAPRAVQVWVGLQFALVAAATMAYLWVEATAPRPLLLAAAALFGATVVAWGGLLERKRWGWPLEVSRLAAIAGLVVCVLA